MSFIDKRQEDDLQALALELCIAVGALDECEVHPGKYHRGGGDFEDAHRVARNRIAREEIAVDDRVNQASIDQEIVRMYRRHRHTHQCPACASAFSHWR